MKIKYPKLLLLLITFVLPYIIFVGNDSSAVNNYLLNLGYLGTFLSGILFVYGFTSGFATVVLLILAREQSILLAGLIAGVGALVGDLVIFKLIKGSFSDEIKRLSKEKFFVFLNKKIPELIRQTFVPVLAYIVIASPLPDEIGVSLLASSTSISTKLFSVLAYVFNTAGIFAVLMIGKNI